MPYMNKQVSLLAATSHAAEVSELKQSLEWAEEENCLVKRQLENKQGMLETFCIFGRNKRCILIVVP